MAQPPVYNRQKNFADDFGNETDHSALNAELDRASNSINDIRFNLAILQADDGKLRPSVVTADSISQELRVSLVEGVVMDAQTMLDRSLAAADASSSAAIAAKASEEAAKSSSEKAAESEKILSQAINADWNATSGKAKILNKPVLSEVALSGKYDDLDGKPDNLATDSDIALLQEEIAKKGVPIGTVEYVAMTIPPPGYLKADGAAVGRMTYPDLFSAIGTTFGEGDGETTFNLPDLIDRFAQGSATPGQKIEAGLPNIMGTDGWVNLPDVLKTGAYTQSLTTQSCLNNANRVTATTTLFDAHLYNPIYGSSDTVQPPALTLLPCIKAFDAATHPGLIDMTGLANDVANKADRDFSNVTQTAIDTSIKWSRPDWSAPVDITNSFIAKGDSYTFSASGIILVTSFDNGYVYLSLNENDVISSGTNIVASDSATGVAYATITTVYENLKLYVTLTSSSNFKVIFYPLAGTQ